MINYVYKNVNPKNKKTADCVIRAISEASGLDYYDVYERLYNISLKTGWILNEKRVEDKLLAELGFIKYKQPKKPNNTKYTIRELNCLIKETDVVVVRIAGHLTCVKNNTCYDTWDCTRKTISNYYIKEK